jgi:OOP family OmpA-OmpF porin
VTLSGYAPLPVTRTRLVDAARAAAGGVDVSDQMAFGRGAPPRFDAAVLLLIDQIGRLKDGKVSLSGTGVTLSGMARDLGGREAIEAALRNLPEGFSVADNKVQAPPYIFQINKDPVAVTLTLGGYVPNNDVHAALVAAASREFVDEKVVDNLKASVGAPQGFANAATVAIGALSRLSTGSLTISDREVRLSGDAFHDLAAEQIRNLGSDLPRGWQAQTDISVKPIASSVDPTVCQQLFSGLLEKAHIRFKSGQDVLDPESDGLLDRLVEIAQRCPSSAIEIGGHTDSAGDAAANQSLSERRAHAVAQYFIDAGVPADRFSEVGYGSSQPVATNDTEEGRAQNRRIEFTVK